MKRHLVLIAIALLMLALGLTACGNNDTSVSDPASPDDPVTSPTDPDDPGDPVGDGEWELVEPSPGTVDPHPSAFVSVEPIGDGSEIAIRYVGGAAPCYVLDRVEIDETDTDVTITLFIGADPAAVTDTETVACIDIGVSYETRVTLDEALGERKVIDGSLAIDG